MKIDFIILCFEFFVNAFVFLIESKKFGQKALLNGLIDFQDDLHICVNLFACLCLPLCKRLLV